MVISNYTTHKLRFFSLDTYSDTPILADDIVSKIALGNIFEHLALLIGEGKGEGKASNDIARSTFNDTWVVGDSRTHGNSIRSLRTPVDDVVRVMLICDLGNTIVFLARVSNLTSEDFDTLNSGIVDLEIVALEFINLGV